MICKLSLVKAKHIKVTVRHTDWWYWESNAPLAMKSQWVDNLRYIAGLQSLEVELETIEPNKVQVSVLHNVLYYKTNKLIDGNHCSKDVRLGDSPDRPGSYHEG